MTREELIKPNQIIRTKRKTIALIVKSNGDFIVRAPQRSNDQEIFEFINKKANWIEKKRTEQYSNYLKPLSFDEIEQVILLGRKLSVTYSNLTNCVLNDNQIILPKENTKLKLILFLKKYAKLHISKRVKLFSTLYHFTYKTVSITSAKTSWGSCNTKNKLNFTYKLILCPEDIIDYIVIHELCHTKIKNHSAQFWSLVKLCCPDYKNAEKWLKENRSVVEMI